MPLVGAVRIHDKEIGKIVRVAGRSQAAAFEDDTPAVGRYVRIQVAKPIVSQTTRILAVHIDQIYLSGKE